MATQEQQPKLPTDQLKQALVELLRTTGQRAIQSATSRVTAAGSKVAGQAKDAGKEALSGAGEKVSGGITETVKEKIGGGGVAGMAKKLIGTGVEKAKDKAKEALGGGGGGGDGKVTNIVEEIDVGVPVSVAYDQWTRFTEFPEFMKKVEKVEQESDTELSWRAQVLWSHRDWKSTITDQVPDERIVWRSEGAKGYVDGAVTFHEISPNLTRILLVLEYYPQGLFEKTGNLWRAQGRRARLELKHFRRHVMTQTLLHPEEAEGWRGEIHDSEVTSEQEENGSEQEENGSPEEQGEEQE